MKISTAKETLKFLAVIGVVFAVVFGLAALNIIYHGGVLEVMSPGLYIMIGLAIIGFLVLVMVIVLDRSLSNIRTMNRREKRSKSEAILDEKYAKEHAFKSKWASIFRTILRIRP